VGFIARFLNLGLRDVGAIHGKGPGPDFGALNTTGVPFQLARRRRTPWIRQGADPVSVRPRLSFKPQ
jgi:hypothetical protein